MIRHGVMLRCVCCVHEPIVDDRCPRCGLDLRPRFGAARPVMSREPAAPRRERGFLVEPILAWFAGQPRRWWRQHAIHHGVFADTPHARPTLYSTLRLLAGDGELLMRGDGVEREYRLP